MVLAEEGGQVGGQAVHELLPLLVALRAADALQPVQVVGEALVAGVAQPARQPAVDHRMLAVVQRDASVLIDQLADPFEVGAAEAELVIDRLDGRRRRERDRLTLAHGAVLDFFEGGMP